MLRARVIGTGSAVPEKVLTNFDLEKLVETSDDWITTRTGIRERRICSDFEFTSTLALKASTKAIEMASVSPDDLDMIIIGTVTPDFPFPATACILQKELGAFNSVAFDISAACSGFVYGLSIAEKFLLTAPGRKALVVGAEVLSRIVDWTDRNTCILFGDGAGAVVLESSESESGILSTHLYTNGTSWELLHQPGPGSRNPVSLQKTLDEKLYYIRMEGNEVFKHAVRGMGDAAIAALETNNCRTEDLALFIPHQANRRIIDATAKRLGLPIDKVFVNLHRYGNTSSASIPIALDEANRTGRIHEGDLVLLDAFGGGFTYGSALIRW